MLRFHPLVQLLPIFGISLPFCLVHPSHKPLRVPISASTHFEHSTPPMRQSQRNSSGTTSVAGIMHLTLSRTTHAFGANIFPSTFSASSADPSWKIPIAIFTIITRVMRPTWAQLVKMVIVFGSSKFILTMARATETIVTPKRVHNNCICKLATTGSSKNYSTTAIVTSKTDIAIFIHR